jgi:N-acetylmuramoyl-L-alanine amidase
MLNLRLNSLKRLILFFLILISNLIFSDNVQAQNKGKIKTVVIDAGHGGKDPGAVGKKAKEKDITLSVAKMTGDYIKQHCPDVNVVYTRSDDTFVSLLRRAQIANEKNADLFISIHCNANASSQPSGVETFVMGEHRNAANLEVAKLENAAIMYEENAQEDYNNFNPNGTEA